MPSHWGVPVDPKIATTGVFHLGGLEFIWEDAWGGVDLNLEEHNSTCKEYKENEECDCNVESDSFLIGFKKNETTYLFDPDPKAEYSAIVRGDINVIQVLRSKWGVRCALCSPCYPGQGDGDTPGEYLAFSVPPDVVGEYGDQKLKKRIFLIGGGKMTDEKSVRKEYPELEKVEQIRERSEPAGAFLDWLVNERGIILAQYHKHTDGCKFEEDEDEPPVWDCGYDEDQLQPCYIGIEKLLAEYFHIDLDKVEKERRQLLEDVRKRGEKND